MRLYILRWNPAISSYKEDGFYRDFYDLSRRNSHGAEMNWSIYESEKLEPGDWFIFCRVGTKHDGIVGLGRFTSKPYLSESWRRNGRQISYADMLFMMLLRKTGNTPWTAKKLEKEFPEVDWHGGHAGVPLDERTAERLAVKMARYIATLPECNTEDVSLRRADGGRFTLVCGLLSNLCPDLLARTMASQTATNAMDEIYMPAYNDRLTVDFLRLGRRCAVESCVRLLDWTGVYPVRDFDVLEQLAPKGAPQSIKKQFSKLLALEKRYDGRIPDYWEMPKFNARLALFAKDVKATIDFLDHDCDRKLWVAMSECLAVLSASLQSVEFIEALERCAERFPRVTRKYHIWSRIQEAEYQLPWELYEQLHASTHYIHVPEAEEYEDAWEWHGESSPHTTTWVFREQEIDLLVPLFEECNTRFGICIDKYEDAVLLPEKLDEAITLCEAFKSEHDQEAAEVVERLLEALKLAKQNGVKMFFNF